MGVGGKLAGGSYFREDVWLCLLCWDTQLRWGPSCAQGLRAWARPPALLTGRGGRWWGRVLGGAMQGERGWRRSESIEGLRGGEGQSRKREGEPRGGWGRGDGAGLRAGLWAGLWGPGGALRGDPGCGESPHKLPRLGWPQPIRGPEPVCWRGGKPGRGGLRHSGATALNAEKSFSGSGPAPPRLTDGRGWLSWTLEPTAVGPHHHCSGSQDSFESTV